MCHTVRITEAAPNVMLSFHGERRVMPILVPHNGRRIYTEEKAKVVAVSWGTELLQILAVL